MSHPRAGIFPLLLLTGRPASGKSEILEYLRRTPAGERRRRFHVGELAVLDDFPMLWAWFEEDRLLAELGLERLHTTADGYFLGLAADPRFLDIGSRQVPYAVFENEDDLTSPGGQAPDPCRRGDFSVH